MAGPSSRCIDLRTAFAEPAFCAKWNRLWQSSDSPLPSARAEHILIWQRHFAPTEKLIGVIVEEDDQLLAAVPLITSRARKIVPCYTLPQCDWGGAGDLLVDVSNDSLAAAMDCLVAGLQKLNRPWIRFNYVPNERASWKSFVAALQRQRVQFSLKHQFDIGKVIIRKDSAPADWTAYQNSWSKNHRRQMRKMLSFAAEQGSATLRDLFPVNENEVEELLTVGFGIEDRSWKGPAGTSVLKNHVAHQFFIDQAKQLARDGELELVFLDFDGQPIAFEYGYRVKETFFSHKVGYEEKFSELSPGQLLRHNLIERYFSPNQRSAGNSEIPLQQPNAIDFLGPLSYAMSSWATESYPISRLTMSTGRWAGNSMLSFSEEILPRIKSRLTKLRKQPQKTK